MAELHAAITKNESGCHVACGHVILGSLGGGRYVTAEAGSYLKVLVPQDYKCQE